MGYGTIHLLESYWGRFFFLESDEWQLWIGSIYERFREAR
jgi:hypothetical protein